MSFLQKIRRGLAVLLFVGLAVLSSGCGGCQDISSVPVAGIVTHKGAAVPNMLVFFSKNAESLSSWGKTDENGKFQLQNDRGTESIEPGTYKVWVEYDPQPTDPIGMIVASEAPQEPPGLKQIRKKFGKRDITPLKIEIRKAETNLEIKLD